MSRIGILSGWPLALGLRKLILLKGIAPFMAAVAIAATKSSIGKPPAYKSKIQQQK
jgi:hypothetical protein